MMAGSQFLVFNRIILYKYQVLNSDRDGTDQAYICWEVSFWILRKVIKISIFLVFWLSSLWWEEKSDTFLMEQFTTIGSYPNRILIRGWNFFCGKVSFKLKEFQYLSVFGIVWMSISHNDMMLQAISRKSMPFLSSDKLGRRKNYKHKNGKTFEEYSFIIKI